MQVDPDFSGLVGDEHTIEVGRTSRTSVGPAFLKDDPDAAIVETVHRGDFVFVGAMNIGPLEDDLVEVVRRLRQVVTTDPQGRLDVRTDDRVVFGRHEQDGLRDHRIRDLGTNFLHRGVPGRSIEAHQEIPIDVPSVACEALYVGIVFLETHQARIVPAGERLQEAVELYEGLIPVSRNGTPDVATAHIVEPSPQVVVLTAVTVAHENVDQASSQELGKVDTSARVILELIEQIRSLDDPSRASETGRSIGAVVRPLFEERQHIGELLPVLPEQRAIGNSDEYRLGVEYTDGLQEPRRDHGSRRVKRGQLVLQDRLDRGSYQLVLQVADSLVHRSQHVANAIDPTEVKRLSGRAATDVEGRQPATTPPGQVGHGHADGRGPKVSVPRTHEGREQAAGFVFFSGNDRSRVACGRWRTHLGAEPGGEQRKSQENRREQAHTHLHYDRERVGLRRSCVLLRRRFNPKKPLFAAGGTLLFLTGVSEPRVTCGHQGSHTRMLAADPPNVTEGEAVAHPVARAGRWRWPRR